MGTRLLIVQPAEKAPAPGDPDPSEAGGAQAEAVAERLTGLGVAAVSSSGLRRARQAAERIARLLGLAVEVDQGLVERFERCLTDLIRRHPDQTVVVVSHGGVTLDLVRNLYGDEWVNVLAPGAIDGGLPNCGITELVEVSGRLTVVTVGDTCWDPAKVSRPPLRPVTDGVVRLRGAHPSDIPVLLAGRDEVFHRWLGPGSESPSPLACVEVDQHVVGWIDYDLDRDWLASGEINVGYNVFPGRRGRGYATRAVQLLMHHLATSTHHRVATLLIDPGNNRSLAVADRAGFSRADDLDSNTYFKRPVPRPSYSDGVVTIRPPRPDDLEADLAAKDEEQIRWLWLPGQRESWEAMSPDERRAHAAIGLEQRVRAFGSGPKWSFSVDTADDQCVAYVDCDLANVHVPRGEANISYSCHPDHRRRGFVSRAVRLVTKFLVDHTGSREAHIVADSENLASLRVPGSLDAQPVHRWINEAGRTMIRHVIPLERSVR